MKYRTRKHSLFILTLSILSSLYYNNVLANVEDDNERSQIAVAQSQVTQNLDERIKNYSSSLKTKKMVDYAVKNKVSIGKINSTGKCNLHVVKAVRHAGYPDWNGNNAYYASQVKDVATKELKYTNLLYDYPEMTPQTAPFGAILVYKAENTSCIIPSKSDQKNEEKVGCGHIEIKTESQFVSDYIDSVPVNHNDKRYTLTAVLIYNN